VARRLLLTTFVHINSPPSVAQYLPMVRALATRVRLQISQDVELDELIGYGTTGLLEAASRFDPLRGDFECYARRRVHGAMYDGLRAMGQLKRGDYARLIAATNAREILDNLAEREQAAAAAGAPPPTVDEDLRALYEALSSVTVSYVTSLEALAADGVEFASDELPADEACDAKRAPARIRTALHALPERERLIIEKHYFEGKTLLQAGAELGLSKSWACRLHVRAIQLLRAQLERHGKYG